MTEPQSITADHVRALLESGPGSRLGLIEGQVQIVGADDDRGVLDVISRDDLTALLGDDPSDDEIDQQAEALTIAARQIGG